MSKKDELVQFSNLTPGTAYEFGDHRYLKLESEVTRANGTKGNSVDLTDGSLWYIGETCTVLKLLGTFKYMGS